MEAEWNHNSGIIKVDEQFIYFIGIGNMSTYQELRQLNDPENLKSPPKKRYQLVLFLVLIALIGAWLIWQSISNGFDPLVLIPLVLLGYMTYQYFTPNLAQHYKIALSDITKMEMTKVSAKIYFIDFNGQGVIQELPYLNQQGIDFFSALHAIIDQEKG